MIRELRAELNSQAGPFKLRQASLTFASWVGAAGGRVRGAAWPAGTTADLPATASGPGRSGRGLPSPEALRAPVGGAQGRAGRLEDKLSPLMTPPAQGAAAARGGLQVATPATAVSAGEGVSRRGAGNGGDGRAAGGGGNGGGESSASEPFETPALHLLELSDADEMEPLYFSLRGSPWLVRHYLERFVFPATMSFSSLKLSASGQELGGSIVFGQRIGFSGTPSDLLPDALGTPRYEVSVPEIDGTKIDMGGIYYRTPSAPLGMRCASRNINSTGVHF